MNFSKEKILSDLKIRRQHFDAYIKQFDLELFTCPSCGYPTLEERSTYDVCDICNWEDDGQDDPQADEIWGGANYKLSLTDSRIKIGTELMRLASKLNGNILVDPAKFFALLKSHSKRMHHIHQKIEGKIDAKHPLWEEYHQMASLIKADLIEKG